MRQGILLGNFLCDRVRGVERFATHPVTSLVKYPPPPPGSTEPFCGNMVEYKKFSMFKMRYEIFSNLMKLSSTTVPRIKNDLLLRPIGLG